ncbi:hypothetical protein [Burkholderia catarinensis]|uniref:hypothetical protein n=1 Tax=Burkholderia catarinensis TaxID=1108140 RepID=UPI000ADF113B|nr:hypothetical protein [Burkholderia catarinensis]KAG8153260.1 hypothetical protein BFF94_011895 [Burkholderia catarinensis]
MQRFSGSGWAATPPAEATELRVMTSGGFTAASGDPLDTISGPSMSQPKEAVQATGLDSATMSLTR